MEIRTLIERKCDELRKQILNEEREIAGLPRIPNGERLQYKALKNGFYLYDGSAKKGFRRVKETDARSVERVHAIQDRRFRMKDLEILKNNLKVLERAGAKLLPQDPVSVLEQLPAAYRRTPWNRLDPAFQSKSGSTDGRTLSDSDWIAMNSEQNPRHPEKKDVDTGFGLKVRSKSEGWIAEFLYRNGYAFRYEPRLTLVAESGPVEFYPDFEIRTSEDTSVFLEHLGRMGDPKYAAKSLRKIGIYADNGILLGRDLFVTMEDLEHPFGSREAEDLINMLKGIIETAA